MDSSETPEIPPQVPKLNTEEDIEAQAVLELPPLAIVDLEDDEISTKSANQNGLLLLPSQLSGNRTWRPGTSSFYKGAIPKPFVYHKPNKDERLEGKQNLQVMDESRASRLTRRLLIICAIVTGVIIFTIAVVVGVVMSTPDQVEESEGKNEILKNYKNAMAICYFSVSDLLRKYDPGEAASAYKKCYLDLVGNGKCDWEIQGNAVGQCDYDRRDCKETPECLDIPVVLAEKGDTEKCEKVLKISVLISSMAFVYFS